MLNRNTSLHNWHIADRIGTGAVVRFYSHFIHLRWRHNGRNSVSNHRPYDCSLNRLFRCRSKKTSKLRVTGLCAGNPPGTGGYPAQMASNAENVSIWWRHHEFFTYMALFVLEAIYIHWFDRHSHKNLTCKCKTKCYLFFFARHFRCQKSSLHSGRDNHTWRYWMLYDKSRLSEGNGDQVCV